MHAPSTNETRPKYLDVMFEQVTPFWISERCSEATFIKSSHGHGFSLCGVGTWTSFFGTILDSDANKAF